MRSFEYRWNTLRALLLALAACLSLGAVAVAQTSVPPAVDPASGIVAFGDSFTEGNQDLTGVTWPKLLGEALGPQIPVTNLGKSGWTSTDIAAREGATDFVLPSFTIPEQAGPPGQVVIGKPIAPTKTFRESANIYPSWAGTMTIGGVKVDGRLRHQIAADSKPRVNVWTFERAHSGPPITVPAGTVFDTNEFEQFRHTTTIIGVGRVDNYKSAAKVVSDVRKMLHHMVPGTHFLIVSVHNKEGEFNRPSKPIPGYTYIASVNRALKKAWPTHFVDTRSYIIKYGFALSHLKPTRKDRSWMRRDMTGPSLLAKDRIHPNKLGYRVMALKILSVLQAKGWAPKGARIPKV